MILSAGRAITGTAVRQMQKVYLLPEMAAIIKPLRQIFISAAHMEKG